MLKNIKENFLKFNLHNNYKEQLFLISIFLVSFVIRRIGLKYGFPLLTHPDEAFSLDPVFYMTVNKTLNSGTFNRPDQILLTINFIYLNLISYIHFGKSLATTYLDNQLLFYYYGRLLICVIGSIIPIIAYMIGKEFKINFGIAAAFVFAFFPSYVIHAHYITPDTLISLLTIWIILFAIKYLNTQKQIYLYAATMIAAINTAEKYPGLLSLLIIFMAILIRIFQVDKSRINANIFHFIKLGVKNLGVFFLSFYIFAPNIIIEFGKVAQTIQYEARGSHLGADNLGWFGNLVFYIESFASFENVFALLFLIIGIFFVIEIKNPAIILLFYGFFYWVVMSYLPLHWERWALPMYISPLFIISMGITYLILKTKHNGLLRIMSLIFVIVYLSHQFVYGLSSSIRLSFEDTRVIAYEFCQDNGITEENSIFEGYTPFNPPNPGVIFDFDFENNGNRKYIILSSRMYERYINEAERYSNETNFYQQIHQQHELIKEIKPTDINVKSTRDSIANIIYFLKLKSGLGTPNRFIGPTIMIYQIKELN